MQSVDTLVRQIDLERAVAVQQRLAKLALEGRGLDAIAAEISAAVGAGVLVLGPAGRPVARHDPGGALTDEVAADLGRELARRGDARPRLVDHPGLSAGAYARPLRASPAVPPQGWIVVAPTDGQVDQQARLMMRQAAAIVGLELMHRGAGETERRLTAGLIGDAIVGRTDGEELGRRLAALGIEGEVMVAVFTVAGAAAERRLQGALAAFGLVAAVSTQEVGGSRLLCAIVAAGERDPIEVVVEARRRLAEEIGAEGAGEIAAGVSRARPAAELSRSFQEARWALGAGEGAVGSWQDLGVESLLLAVGDEDVLRLYRDRLLGPVLASDSLYAAELLRSLEVFILHNGQWERAARELHCHRHTLRYRMRKLEELTGRDLSRATDRIEFWLALRAHELISRAN